jgi:2-dehydropantoate 2-reductase
MLDAGMREIAEVARALDVPIEDGVREQAWSFLNSLPAAGTASLQRDIAAGRPSELDDWSGAVMRLGSGANVATPVHSFIYDCLLPLEMRARGTLTFAD